MQDRGIGAIFVKANINELDVVFVDPSWNFTRQRIFFVGR